MELSKEQIDQLFEGMSPEDLELLRKELGVEDKKEEPPVPPPVVDHNKIADAVVSRIPQPQAPEAPPQPKEAFDMKRFQEQFLSDPLNGLDYAYQAKLGYSPSQVLPVMLAALAQTKQEMEALKAKSFRSQAQIADEDWAKVEQFRQQKGMDWEDAYDLAKARGIIQAKADTPAAPVAPPRLPRGGGKETPTVDEATLLSQLANLDDDKLESLMLRQGLINSRHLTR